MVNNRKVKIGCYFTVGNLSSIEMKKDDSPNFDDIDMDEPPVKDTYTED